MTEQKPYTEFTVLKAGGDKGGTTEMQRLVNNDGWELHGDPYWYDEGEGPRFAQMLKRVVNDD